MDDFLNQLQSQITPEWKSHYLNYRELSDQIDETVKTAPSRDLHEYFLIEMHYAKFIEIFMKEIDNEFKKVDTFFAEKLAEAQMKHAYLTAEIRDIQKQSRLKKADRQKLYESKNNLCELYLSMVFLKNYQTLNAEGFRHILKKFDESIETTRGQWYMQTRGQTTKLFLSEDLKTLLSETEDLYGELEGNKRKALEKLRSTPIGPNPKSLWVTFGLGLFLGAFFTITCILIVTVAVDKTKTEKLSTIIFGFFRGPLIVILMVLFNGIDILIWKNNGVNHILIFELDPRNHLTCEHVMQIASLMGFVWGLCTVLFVFSDDMKIPMFISPLVLYGIILIFLFNPIKILWYDARIWLLKRLGEYILAPFFHVDFADIYVAEQINSLTVAFSDLHFSICMYVQYFSFGKDWENDETQTICKVRYTYTITVLNSLPYLLRSIQCFRRCFDYPERRKHSVINGLKYVTQILVYVVQCLTILNSYKYKHIPDNPYLYCWVVLIFLSSLYQYWWDLLEDWNLCDINYKFLRARLHYPRAMYYFAMLYNLVLRFSWIILYFAFLQHLIFHEYLVAIFAFLEVVRRFIWNIIRLENEHLNTGEYYIMAVDLISSVPIDDDLQEQIVKAMDEEDGVVHRRSKDEPKRIKRRTSLFLHTKV